MYSIRYGADVSVETVERKTAREALQAAEEYIAANRPHVIVTDTSSQSHVSLDALREHAEAEAEIEAKGSSLPPPAI